VGFFSSFFFFSFSPSVVLLDFICRAFGRFVTRGVKKRDKKIVDFFSQPSKKAHTHLRHFFFVAKKTIYTYSAASRRGPEIGEGTAGQHDLRAGSA
jgi:hypothetical protein